ncbi:MAG: hypothetical protein WC205_04270 [Opitutaceae bacterium]|jgi:hypothetical protein
MKPNPWHLAVVFAFLVFAYFAAGCSSDDNYPKVYNYSNLPPKLNTVITGQVEKDKVIGGEVVTLKAKVAEVRSLAKGAVNEAQINARLDEMGLSLEAIMAAIKKYPAAKIAPLAASLDAKIGEDAKPDKKILVSLYAGAALCFLLAIAAGFFSGWLASVPVVGAFLSNTLGKHAVVLLLAIGAGLIVVARFYTWAAKHPRLFDGLVLAGAVLATLIYANAHNEGLLAAWWEKLKGLFRSKTVKAG